MRSVWKCPFVPGRLTRRKAIPCSDMTKRLLDFDPLSGIRQYFEYDALTDETHIYTEGDAEVNLEWSRGLQKDDDYSRKGMKKEMWHYAHIPAVILHKWMVEGVDINDTKALIKKVNHPDYAYLKTTTKKHA